MHRVDLTPWSGQEVELSLATGDAPESTLAFWGAPVIRQAKPETERPQVVIVFLADTLRPDHLEAWGHDRETAPTVAQLANEGLRFERTIAQATWTKASVPSILTGVYPASTGIFGVRDRLAASETTVAEVFRDAGYATFSTSSIPFTGRLTNLHQGVEVMAESAALADPNQPDFHAKTAKA